MNLVDTHCHIQSIGATPRDHTHELWTKLGLDAEQVIESAVREDVTKMICVGCDLNDSALATDFAAIHDGCFASLGIHPHEANRYEDEKEIKAAFRQLAAKPKVVAIGECGLDYFYRHSTPEDQQRLLGWQLDLAIELKLPVIFHVREAFGDFWPILKRYEGKIQGVLHSFTDNQENLNLALEAGLYIGLNGIATFTKSDQQIQMYRSIPMERLVLETDAPYLTPTPYRGTINEPKHIRTIAEFVSSQRSIGLEDVAEATTRNAHLLFKI